MEINKFIRKLKRYKVPLYLRTYNSPFKPIKLKFYFGKVARGVPYFMPRKWVRLTDEEVLEKARESMNNPKMIEKPFDEWVRQYKNYTKPIPKKFGFDFVELGWKTKFGDFRFEHSPIWSIVAFGYQFTITFVAPHLDHYWECFLFYHYRTDKSKSRKERIKQCKKEYPCTWRRSYNGKEEIIDYYELILKNKYKEITN